VTIGCDILVVGGGVIGAAIAYHLACADAGEVVLCERAPLPARGATSRSAGLIRMHHTSMDVVPLALASSRTYAHWRDTVGGDCGFRRTGFALVVGPEHAGDAALRVLCVSLRPGALREHQHRPRARRLEREGETGDAAAEHENLVVHAGVIPGCAASSTSRCGPPDRP
jgi:choline dehydrogenase-like flavoprotein